MKRLSIIKFLNQDSSRFPDMQPLLAIADSVKIELINQDMVNYNKQYSIILELKSNQLISDVVKVCNCYIDNRIQSNIKNDGNDLICVLDRIPYSTKGINNEQG